MLDLEKDVCMFPTQKFCEIIYNLFQQDCTTCSDLYNFILSFYLEYLLTLSFAHPIAHVIQLDICCTVRHFSERFVVSVKFGSLVA